MKRAAPLSLIFALLFLLCACGGKTPGKTASSPEPVAAGFENPGWPVFSVRPEDYGIVYDAESVNRLSEYPLDKLMAYYLGADGAYSVGASAELYGRFIEAPRTVAACIALLGDAALERGEPARDALCKAIAQEACYGGAGEFSQALEACRDAFPSGAAAKVLERLEEAWAALERAS